MAAYYAAYRAFAEILERPEHEAGLQAVTGRPASSSTTAACCTAARRSTTAGGRHLQGCYADRDGLLSTLAVLRERTEGRA